MKRQRILVLTFTLFANYLSFGQDGLLDLSFNTIGAFNGTVVETKVQSDGKVVVVGQFTNYHDHQASHICRLNIDGTYDETFLSGTGFGIGGEPLCVEIQSDGKILVGGYFVSYNGITLDRTPVIRLNTNGTIDNTFDAADHTFTGPKYMGSVTVRDLLIQPTGKIIAVGDFDYTIYTYISPSAYTEYIIRDIIRLNTDGTHDNTFNIGTGSNSSFQIAGVRAQADGALVIAGAFSEINGVSRNKICRVDSEGNLDNSYNLVAFSYGEVRDFEVVSNDNIVLVGSFTSFNGQAISRIVKLNSNGIVDNTFSCILSNDLQQIAIQSDGKYIISGSARNTIEGNDIQNVLRLNTNGSFDQSFTNLDFTLYESNSYTAITIQPDDKILIGGTFNSYNNINCNNIVRLNSNGDVDVPFNLSKGPGGEVTVAKALSDGKILVAGNFGTCNNEALNIFCRFNSNGSIDGTFNTGSGFHYIFFGDDVPKIYSINVQSDGKYLVAGAFQVYNGVGRNNLVRLNPDGTIDNSLQPLGVNNVIRNAIIQPDGKILLIGLFDIFSDVNGNYSAKKIIRLNHDGSLDLDFFLNKGTGANLTLYSSCLQADGKILIGGQMTSFNGTPVGRMTRLNSDGSIDNSFNIGTGANDWVMSIQMIDDGRILITGHFTSFNGTAAAGLAILNSDGTVDPSFQNFYQDGRVSCVYQQKDHKLLVGGVFSNFGPTHENLVRLNSDGTVDPTFNAPAFGGFLNNIYPYDETRIIINTNMYDHYTINGLCRVFIDDPITNANHQENLKKDLSFILYPNPLHGNLLTLKLDEGLSQNNQLSIYDATGVKIYEQLNISHDCFISSSSLKSGVYLIKLTDLETNVVYYKRLVVE